MSLNAWGGAVWPALRDWIPTLGADVLLLQEVTRAPQPSPDWLVYADPFRRLDQRANLFGDVSALLPNYTAHFAPAARGDLWDADGAMHRSEHGIAAWVAPHLAVAELRQSFAYGAFRPDGWGEEPVPRALQALRIWRPDTAQTVVVSHLHGLRDPMGKGDSPARRQQAETVVATLADMAPPGEPVVLAGDLNILPNSETFTIWAQIGLQDLIFAHAITDTRTDLYTKPQRFADYTLVNAEVNVRAFTVPPTPIVSDHRAMILDIV